MHISKKEIAEIHPHKTYGCKCGQHVSYMGESHIFLGYVEADRCMIATHSGDKKVVYLNQIRNN